MGRSRRQPGPVDRSSDKPAVRLALPPSAREEESSLLAELLAEPTLAGQTRSCLEARTRLRAALLSRPLPPSVGRDLLLVSQLLLLPGHAHLRASLAWVLDAVPELVSANCLSVLDRACGEALAEIESRLSEQAEASLVREVGWSLVAMSCLDRPTRLLDHHSSLFLGVLRLVLSLSSSRACFSHTAVLSDEGSAYCEGAADGLKAWASFLKTRRGSPVLPSGVTDSILQSSYLLLQSEYISRVSPTSPAL